MYVVRHMPWNMSNPLYRWKLKHGKLKGHRKANKSKSVHITNVKPMARRRRRFGRIRRARPYRRMRSYFRRRDKRLPLSVGIGLATSVLSPATPGWDSSINMAKNGDYAGAVGGFIRSWTGIYGVDGKEEFGIHLLPALNPFDFSDAPAWKATLWSSIIMRAIKKVSHVDPISKVPLVNKYIKFS